MGDGVSQLGSQLSGLALPVLAVGTLGASAWEMGVLEASSQVAFLLIGLPAGAWVDRMRTRRVLVVGDLVRAAAFLLLPLAIWVGGAAMWQLYVAAFVAGVCTVFFDVAWQSFLPALLDDDQLVDGNAKLTGLGSVASVAGPAVGGALLRTVGAPLLVAIDAVSFVVSAAFVGAIRHDGPPPPARADRRPLRSDVAEGLRFVLGNPLLRRITMSTALTNLAFAQLGAVYVIFVLRTLDLSQSTLGFIYALGSVGAVLGAVVASRAARLLGEGRAIPIAVVVGSAASVLIPLTRAIPVEPVVVQAVAWGIVSGSGVIYNVTQISFRQRLCPPHLRGRMNASVRFIVWGTLPIGSVLGGLTGAWLGVEATIWMGVALGALAVIPVATSPLARMRDLPRELEPGV